MHCLRGRIVTGDPALGVLEDGIVAFQGAEITWVGPSAAASADLRGRAVPVPVAGPGLVDIHCHGAGGHTFGTADALSAAEGAREIAEHCAAHGTTGVLASLVTAPAELLEEQVRALSPLVHEGVLAGIHLEGPFLAPSMSGAQDPEALRAGDTELLRRWIRAGAAPQAGGRNALRSITLAPEVPGVPDLLPLLREAGIVPGIGHTAATAAQTRQLVERSPGPWTGTHVFNRMPPLAHRAPGPLAVLLQEAARGEAVLELIPDGVHTDSETVRTLFALLGPERIALITDAMAAAGLGDGHFTLGAMAVEVRHGEARLVGAVKNPGALAGGTSHQTTSIQRLLRESCLPLEDLWTASSTAPARALGLRDRGVLSPGRRADLLVTDPQGRPLQVFCRGQEQPVRSAPEGTAHPEGTDG